MGDCLSVLPFSNALIVVNITGAQLRALLQYGTQHYEMNNWTGFPAVAGLEYTIDVTRRSGDPERITEMKRLDPEGRVLGNVEDDAVYGCVVTDFMLAGGDGYDIMFTLPVVATFGDAASTLIEFVQACGNIDQNSGFLKTGIVRERGEAQPASGPVAVVSPGIDTVQTFSLARVFNALISQLKVGIQIWRPSARLAASSYVTADTPIMNDLEFLESLAPHTTSYISAKGIVLASAPDHHHGVKHNSVTDDDLLIIGDDFQHYAGRVFGTVDSQVFQKWLVPSIVLLTLVVLWVASVIFLIKRPRFQVVGVMRL
jgi:hypothetical protein